MDTNEILQAQLSEAFEKKDFLTIKIAMENEETMQSIIFDECFENCELDFIEYLIKHNCNLDVQDKNGLTLLMEMITNVNYDAIKALIENGINVNIQNRDGNTPLHLANLLNLPEIIELIVSSFITDLFPLSDLP
jgi:ankyrin repeat protein